ncbi:MAG: RdgB/HAM1 family non-canonical purine NTP pyrophosphatase [Nitrososphaera sp.]
MAKEIAVVSGNESKAREIIAILSDRGFSPVYVRAELQEIQSDSLEQIASRKAIDAYSKVGRPVVVEDDGLFIESLRGFPGAYSSYVFRTIGCEGILRLLQDAPDRRAYFLAIVAFYDGEKSPMLHTGRVSGAISNDIFKGGWGYDPIFVPEGSGMTFAQMGETKNRYSHRSRALEEFAKSWKS